MSWNMPANFIAHADQLESQAPLSESVWPDHAVDLYRHGGEETLVTLCNDGQLRKLRADSALPREVKNELACHRVSSPSVRTMNASEYFLMDVRTLDTDEGERQQRMARLSGALYHPDHAWGQGELVLRVSELLYALCQAARQPFRYSSGAFYPLTLPGDSEESLRRGSGLILAYAIPPLELRTGNLSNSDWMKQAFFDCLSTIQNDLKEVKPKAPFSLFTLPVPSRSMLIADLKQQGYQIVQDRAVASLNSGSLAGRLLKVFGNLTGQGAVLPPEASLEDYLKIGEETLQNHFEPVPYRMKALHFTPPPPPAAAATGVASLKTIQSIPKPPPPPPTPQLPTQPKQNWSEDFGPSRPNPTRPAAKPAPRTAPKPDWSKDFE